MASIILCGDGWCRTSSRHSFEGALRQGANRVSKSGLELRDYLDAARLASDRARTVTFVLVVASVIMLIGMMNALDHAWMQRRLLNSRSAFDQPTRRKAADWYVRDFIGPGPVRQPNDTRESFEYARKAYDERFRILYSEFTRSFVESGFGVKVPLFGVTIDTNDMGAFGGFALLVIIFMFDYSVRREHDNLSVAFNRAMDEEALPEFYDVLAMHQLLTVPRRTPTGRRGISALLPKFICLLPLIVQGVVLATDINSDATGDGLDPLHNTILFWLEAFWFLLILVLSTWTLRRLFAVDRTWDHWAKERFEKHRQREHAVRTPRLHRPLMLRRFSRSTPPSPLPAPVRS